MTWGKGRPRRDPLLTTRKHRDHNRAYWQARREPCRRAGCVIDYDGPQYLPDGSRNPRYLVVGHIVSRSKARELGWTAEQINDLSNTQPECLDCSNRSGALEGQEVRTKGGRPAVRLMAPEASHW
jgi:hypothetical protein